MSLPDSRAWIEIHLGRLHANVQTLQTHFGPQTQIMAVVKADAYGHGLLPVAQTALEAGAHWIGVATVAEGIALRQAGITDPVLLLCAAAPGETLDLLAHNLTPLLGDEASVHTFAQAAQGKSYEVHLELDTGIGRAGVLPENAVALWKFATHYGLRVTGLATHFADADNPNDTFSAVQYETFRQTFVSLLAVGARFDHIHLCNSPASLGLTPLPGSIIRPGLLLYGLHPAAPAAEIAVQPVLALKARVATVRDLPTGHPISYGSTHHLTRPSRVATVLIGYGDGYPRLLSNKGAMLLNGKRAPILGRVCMDQTVVDVTDIPGVVPGDEAVCIGSQQSETLSAEEIAHAIETTEHEITTNLSARLPRLYLP